MPRDSNMFRISELGGGSQIWLPNPDIVSGNNLIATLVNSGRNAKAIIVAQKIGRDQTKVTLAWHYLEKEVWEGLLRFWDDSFFFNLYFYNRVSGDFMSRKCYIGDRTDRPFNIDTSGIPTAYVDCAANVVDTGEGA